MILVVGFALLVASVVLRRGRVRALADLHLRGCRLVAGAVALQVLVMAVLPGALPHWLAAGLHLVSYALGVAFLLVNRRVPGLWLVGIGGLCNLAAIAANGGVMPASESAVATAGLPPAGEQFANSAALADPRLAFLGDIFAVPDGVPLANVFSVGDVVLLLGAGVLLHRCARDSVAEQSGA
jgi:hypothetical protein